MEKLRKIAFEKRLEKKTTILAIKNNGLIKKIEKLNALLVDKTNKLGQTKEGLRKQKLQLDVNFLTEKINGLRRRVLENNNSILQLNTTKKGFKEVEKSKTKIKKDVKDKVAKINEQIKKAILKGDEVRIQKLKEKKEDALKFFNKMKYFYTGITDLKDLYSTIKSESDTLKKNKYNVSNVILQMANRYENKVRGISIPASVLSKYEHFIDYIESIKNGGGAGSDAFFTEDELGDNIELSTFSLIYYNQPTGRGDHSKLLFECEKIDTGFCGYECLKKCGYEYTGDKKDLYSLIKIKEIILSNGLEINIIGNVFDVIEKERGEYTKEIKVKNKKGREFNIGVWDVSLTDIQPIKILDIGESKYTIVYDEINKHFDLITGDFRLVKNVSVDYSNSIYLNGELLFNAKQITVNSLAKPPGCEFEYVFFDYETVIDFETSSCMREYSLSILNLTPEQLEELTNADNEGNSEKVDIIRSSQCKTFIGYDCSKKFIQWILENQCNKIFCFVGFNNTNFDNFIFLDALLQDENNPNKEYNVSDIFYNGSQLLNFKINNRHHTFDIHKHLMGSLRANCESFKIKCCKKLEFDHNKAQELYLNDKLIEFITGSKELKDYNEFDVLATAVLFNKYRLALKNVPATSDYAERLSDTKTVGSLIFKVFENHLKDKKINLPKLNYEQYTDLQKYKIAGRVELFNGAKEVNERLASTDVCSLYPFVMAILNCYYPCGDNVKEVKSYQGDDTIGFYYCDIDQTNLKGKNLPNIYAEKLPLENKWDSQEILKDYLISNVMIGLLKKYDCKVVIKSGFIFENKIKSCELFGFLLDFMKEKNNQDTLKKNKSGEYNSALRETLKLLMNSLSGKVIEGLHCEKTEAINSVAEFEKIKDKSLCVNVINSIGDKIFITYEVSPEKLCVKQQRPIYLGVLIYDYAKRYMYENSYSKVGLDKLLYTDTDASKFRYKDFGVWKKWVDDSNIQVPHWKEVEEYDERYKDHKIYVDGSKVFGSFEDELEEMVGDDYKFYCIEKKSWLYSYKKNDKWNSKFRFKGINGDARLLTLEEDFIGCKEIKHKNGSEEKHFYIQPFSEEKVYQYYIKNNMKSIENGNEIKFFKQIFETGEGYVLCQSFRKIVKNNKRNVKIDDDDRFNDLVNRIQVCYQIKHINIRKK